MKNFKELIIGIDFGTTNTVISYYDNGTKIFNDSIYKLIPTKIHFGENIACGNYIPLTNSEKNDKILSNFKTKIGSNFETIFNNEKIDEFNILFIFFNHIKNILDIKFKKGIIYNTVLTVPSNFNDNQRKILFNVLIKTNFNILRIINEPTAAAFSYGLNNTINDEQIMVFDIGGGTLDISVLEIDDSFFETIESVGINDIGGNNFTNMIYEDAIRMFKENFSNKEIIISKNKLLQLWHNCNKVKEKFIWVDSCEITINDFYKNVNLKYQINKQKFKTISKSLLDRISRKLTPFKNNNNIKKVLLVGGSSKLEIIQELIETELRIKPLIHNQLQYVVALGACHYGALLKGKLSDNIILVDNLPLSLGIETADGTFSVIIPKNTPLPTKRSQKYTIDTPGEEEVTLKIYQGERSIAAKNHLIGEFTFDKISKVNVPIINIIFNVDINGIINVTIEDKHSGSTKDILVRNINEKSKKEIDAILKIAEDNKNVDENESVKSQLIYKLDNRISSLLNNLKLNTLIPKNESDEVISRLIEYLDKLNNKTIQELIKIDTELDQKYFTLQNIDNEIIGNEDNNNSLNIEDIIKKEKIEFLKSKIDFYKNKDITDFQMNYLNKISDSLNNNIEDIDNKIDSIKELFKENDREELLDLCLFLKEEITNFNLNISNNQYKILSEIVNKYLNLLNKNVPINYKTEIDNINKICEDMINSKN